MDSGLELGKSFELKMKLFYRQRHINDCDYRHYVHNVNDCWLGNGKR